MAVTKIQPTGINTSATFTFADISVTGNITANIAGNATLGNTVTANFFIGNGSLLTGISGGSGTSITNGNSNVSVSANSNVTVSVAGNTNIATFTGTGANIAGYANILGDLTAANANLGNAATANFFIGDGGLLSNISASGGASITNGNSNVVVDANSNVRISVTGTANVLVVSTTGANLQGTFNTNGIVTGTGTGGNITGVDYITANFFVGAGNNLSNIQGSNVTGAVGSATFAGLANAVAGANVTGAVGLATFATTANAVAGANVTGAVGLATFATTANAVAGANVTGQVANALVASTVYTNAQPNITSVGTLTSLSISGNLAFTGLSANLGTVSNVKITGGTANYLLKTDGTGNLSWVAPLSVPAGNTTELQFNNAGSFASTPGITYDSGNSRLSLKNYSIVANVLGSVTGATTININLGTYVTATATGSVTWTFTNPAAATNASGFILELTNGGSFAQIWPASVKWPSAAAPTLTGLGVDLLSFITDDNGTTWRGVASMIDSR